MHCHIGCIGLSSPHCVKSMLNWGRSVSERCVSEWVSDVKLSEWAVCQPPPPPPASPHSPMGDLQPQLSRFVQKSATSGSLEVNPFPPYTYSPESNIYIPNSNPLNFKCPERPPRVLLCSHFRLFELFTHPTPEAGHKSLIINATQSNLD